MIPPRLLPHFFLAAILGTFAVAAFLLPTGAGLAHTAFEAALALGAAALCGYAYARIQEPTAIVRDESLRPEVAWQVIYDDLVPTSLLEGGAPLIVLVREGEVPHPNLPAMLVPYFAEPSLAFVQGATRYDGISGVADAFRLQAAIGSAVASARIATDATVLRGSGAVVSREALQMAYQPGDTWGTLGVRLQALGYRGLYEPEPTTLAWAPLTVSEYGARLVADTRAGARLALLSLRARGLSLSARLQYLAAAATPAAIWAAAAAAGLSAMSLVAFDVGPFIVSSPAALPGAMLAALCAAATLVAFRSLSGVNPVRPAALALAGAYTVAGETAYRVATSEQLQRVWRVVADAARETARATVPANGNADTAPAGSPARL